MVTYVFEISFVCPECRAGNDYRLTVLEAKWNGTTAGSWKVDQLR